MGIDTFIENENGERIDHVLDSEMRLSRAILSEGFDSTVCLRFIDPYGDATFNYH
jgi:hypothetical protein